VLKRCDYIQTNGESNFSDSDMREIAVRTPTYEIPQMTLMALLNAEQSSCEISDDEDDNDTC